MWNFINNCVFCLQSEKEIEKENEKDKEKDDNKEKEKENKEKGDKWSKSPKHPDPPTNN